jgi:hypothetical protein
MRDATFGRLRDFLSARFGTNDGLDPSHVGQLNLLKFPAFA